MATYAGRYSEDLQDRYGNAFRNAKVAVETLAGAAVTLYADRDKTAYIPASGLAANEIKADDKGNLRFFADPGNYQIVVTPTGGSVQNPVPVSVFPDPLEPDASQAELDALDARIDDLPGSSIGILADRPAASADNTGDLYVASDVDGGTLYRSNGSSWVQISAGVVFGIDQPIEMWAIEFSAPNPGALGPPSANGYIGTGTTRTLAWLFDPATPERITGVKTIPQHWNSVDVLLYWSNPGTGTGDVRWLGDYKVLESANSVDGTTAFPGGTVTATAPAQYVLKVTTLAAGLAINGVVRWTFARRASDPQDTLDANDAALIGIVFARAS